MESDPRMRAWRAFLEAHARVTELLESELQREKNLSLAWYDVLVQLQEADGHRLRMTELAQRVLLSKSGLTRLVDRMCAVGFVRRTPDKEDRRGRWVCLTQAGDARLSDAAETHIRGVHAHFADRLTDAEALAVEAVLSAIAEAAERERT